MLIVSRGKEVRSGLGSRWFSIRLPGICLFDMGSCTLLCGKRFRLPFHRLRKMDAGRRSLVHLFVLVRVAAHLNHLAVCRLVRAAGLDVV